MADAKCCDRCRKFYVKNDIVLNKRFSNSPVVGFRYETDNNA